MLLDRFRQRTDAFVAGDAPGALDPEIRGLLGGRVRRVTVEIVRPNARESKIFTMAKLEGAAIDDAALSRAGFVVQHKPAAVRMTREREWLLAFPSAGHLEIEHAIAGGPIDLATAAASLAGIASIAVFAQLARGDANLVAWGVGWDDALGPLGRVQIHRDLERRELDETALREAGFRDVDEGLWTIPRTKTSVVWMGGTVYGYVGDVPDESVGSWPGSTSG
jgi:hypothetical protein